MTIKGVEFDLYETSFLELIFIEQDIIRFILLVIQLKSTNFVSLHGLRTYNKYQQDEITHMISNRTSFPHH